jgi:fructose-bisphosphate aldolase class II
MPVASLSSALESALAGRYAVPAFNVFDPTSMDAVLAAAERLRSPVVVQVSVKTAMFWGVDHVRAVFDALCRLRHVEASLHLDHCGDAELVLATMAAGWNSALFDASGLEYDDAVCQTAGLVKRAAECGFDIEGEVDPVPAVETSAAGAVRLDPDRCVDFIEQTGVTCFSPVIGTRHGMHKGEPTIDYAGLGELSRRIRVPMVLHGGSGLSQPTLCRLIDLGVAKVNVSSELKAASAAAIDKYRAEQAVEPLALTRLNHEALGRVAERFVIALGSGGRATG